MGGDLLQLEGHLSNISLLERHLQHENNMYTAQTHGDIMDVDMDAAPDNDEVKSRRKASKKKSKEKRSKRGGHRGRRSTPHKEGKGQSRGGKGGKGGAGVTRPKKTK